ncbi:hypothetical protein VIBNISOn1_190054 [Vibrio nigripulchritudo SOn1]|uniref:Uncharacterized protein n=1 Tax=Vibrio nigripulchritudo SOn1 TaxID=1238450 RepID=A0AAV2VQT4_9VIBR|nr:hypothetical protein [Vibrio nigripulchritudo]CCO46835.1 hypothetical protein VIBNISOn1_190054 [Vibrio nigripulchritudo SOn1]
MSTRTTVTKESLESLNDQELEDKKKELDKELEKEQDQQHQLMQQVQSSSLQHILKGIEITQPRNAEKPEPLVQVTPQPQRQESVTQMSALAVATANFLNRRDAERQINHNESSAEKVAELDKKLGKGGVINGLVKDSKSHIKTLTDPSSTQQNIIDAAKSLKNNIATINQTLNSQIKDLQYADKKSFDKAEKKLGQDVKRIKSLGDEVSKHAAKLEARNTDLPDDLKMNFHSLGDNIKEMSHNIGKAIQDIAAKLNPQSLGMRVGG